MMSWDPKQTLESIGIGEKDERKRSTRVAEAIRNELATLILSKVRDPKLQDVTISRVEVSGDLSMARVYFTVYDAAKQLKSAQVGLERARGFMRSHIAKTLNLRFTPALDFRYDDIADKVAELEDLFQEIAHERETRTDSSREDN